MKWKRIRSALGAAVGDPGLWALIDSRGMTVATIRRDGASYTAEARGMRIGKFVDVDRAKAAASKAAGGTHGAARRSQ